MVNFIKKTDQQAIISATSGAGTRISMPKKTHFK